MNISKEITSGLTATLKVEVSREDYAEKVEKALKDHQKKAQLHGFRPGKVPFGLIKKMYGKAVTADEVNSIVSEKLTEYFKEEKLDILGQPMPNMDKNEPIDFDVQDSFAFYFDIGMSPDVHINLSDQLSVPFYHIAVDESVVEKRVNEIRKRYGTFEHPEETKEGDILQVEVIILDENGIPAEGREPKKTYLNLENIKQKETLVSLLAAKKNDKIRFNPLSATGDKELASHLTSSGKEDDSLLDKEYEFTILDVIHIEPASLDEGLFRKAFPQDVIETEEQFRDKIKSESEIGYKSESEKFFFENVVKALIKEAGLELPDEFLKRWLLDRNEEKITREQLDLQYPSYADTLRWQIVENKILTDNNIKVGEEDVKAYIRGYFLQQFDQHDHDHDHEHEHEHEHEHDHEHEHEHDHEHEHNHEKEIESLVGTVMENQELVKKIYDELYDKQLMDLFKSKVTVSEKEITVEEFIKLNSQI